MTKGFTFGESRDHFKQVYLEHNKMPHYNPNEKEIAKIPGVGLVIYLLFFFKEICALIIFIITNIFISTKLQN